MTDDARERTAEWEARMDVVFEFLGPRSWLDEARQQRARRRAAEAKVDHLSAALALSERAEHDRSRQLEATHNAATRVRFAIWDLVGCNGLRAEHCRDCDWSTGETCLADGKPLGEWGR